jgi:hypothetical protein
LGELKEIWGGGTRKILLKVAVEILMVCFFEGKKGAEKKFHKPMNKLGLSVSPSSFIYFHNFISSLFLSLKPNIP